MRRHDGPPPGRGPRPLRSRASSPSGAEPSVVRLARTIRTAARATANNNASLTSRTRPQINASPTVTTTYTMAGNVRAPRTRPSRILEFAAFNIPPHPGIVGSSSRRRCHGHRRCTPRPPPRRPPDHRWQHHRRRRRCTWRPAIDRSRRRSPPPPTPHRDTRATRAARAPLPHLHPRCRKRAYHREQGSLR